MITMQNLYKDLEKILLANDTFKSEDGKILKNKVTESAIANDKELISQLLKNPKLKEHFFDDVENGVLVFDREKFVRFINNKEFLPNSYTTFTNKIGLHTGDEYLSTSDKVSLVWPYKDCVLEGGQDKEDQKRSEIFYNETLAPDEIDRLFEKKVLTGFKKYDEKGSSSVKEFSGGENLIVKGNNLLALHSLKQKYSEKVKLIYIDPPYYFNANKKEDTFAYNSNFKLSTWLTFMRNRLTVARDLLSEDGALAVQISDDGVGMLHTLLAEVFNTHTENNFINKITVKTKSPSGFASVNAGVFETAEYILIFAKNKKSWTYNQQYVASGYDSNYKWFIENRNEDFSKWKITDVAEIAAHNNDYKTVSEAKESLGDFVFRSIVADFAFKNAGSIFQSTAIGDNAGKDVVDAREKSKKHKDKVFKVSRQGQYDVFILNGREMAFYSRKIREIDGKLTPSIQLSNIWTDTPYEGIAREGDVSLKGGKKPEKLLKRIIEMTTNKGDLVLDYHLGSGTTAAVAHKLGRKYIGIEQLDYGDNDSVKRLQNVIRGDASGISKIVNWKGGGSFVYAELMELNQAYIDEIEKADTPAKLSKIHKKMQDEAFFRYEVDLKKFDVKEFSKLPLADQKQVLLECLDKNHLYVNYSEIDDATYKVSAEDKKLNKVFYGE